MALMVLRAGVLTTLQDLGRWGWQRFGVPVGGVMDEMSHRLANLLVGNREEEATLEMTITGAQLQFTEETLFALCGGDFGPAIRGKRVPMARPVLVRAGALLDIGHCRLGARAYLAVAGGFEVPEVLGSKSTYLRGGFGGFEGRALKRGDWLPTGPRTAGLYGALWKQLAAGAEFATPKWSVQANAALMAHTHHNIRFVPGRHWERFPAEIRERFCASEYRIAPDSDRMGYRLDGPELQPAEGGDILSEGVTFGTIQVPPDGRPIVLMANRQTTGGYPRVGEVASVDLPLLAQLPPGDTVRFQQIALDQSQTLYLERERELALLREAVHMRMRQ
jgi:antagonist of KipI